MLTNGLISLLAIAGLASNALAGPVRKVSNAGTAGTIADKYIVVLKNGLSESAVTKHTNRISSFHSNVARDLTGARAHGVGRKFRFSATGFNGYSGGFDKTTLQEILNSPEVDYVEQDTVVTINAIQKGSTWGLARISHADYSPTGDYNYEYDEAAGKGTAVYVIDTGIRITHDEFKTSNGSTRAFWGANFASGGDSDGNGHGTHCAGTIAGNTYGVAKKANVVAVKVLSAGGSGTTSGVIAGMNWVVTDTQERGWNSVASMSLGGPKSAALNAAVDSIFNAGITIVVAAGNENQNAANVSPASAPNAITVGAADSNNRKASFSNYGAVVDVFAPGVSVLSSWATDDKATRSISGTSMACPHVAGLAAYYISTTGNSDPAAITEKIVGSAVGQLISPPKDTTDKIAYNGYA
ncbi:subtilisin-like serine protease [Orbilia javanica]|uniref:Serine protease SP1 n=1 Tax=Orbilia javanica TaxID=47235 RepID=A0A2P0JZV6_9PEZI|nr:serine protease SP1 [Orbilia javanica]